MVMRLNFEGDIVCICETHDTRVITERRDEPIWSHLFRCLHKIAFEQASNGFLPHKRAVTIELTIFNGGLEGLMRAMFRPRLCQRL